MTRILLLFLAATFSFLSKAQTELKESYIIKANGERQNIYLKTESYFVTPSSIIYFISKDGKALNANPENTKEIGYTDKSLIFKSTFTTLDENPDNTASLSLKTSNKRSEKQIFVKQMVSGTVNLYSHSTTENTRFYLQKGEGPIYLLLYRKYLDNDGVSIREEKGYQKQLFEIARCPSDDYADAASVKYEEKNLVQEIIDYHNCYDLEFQEIKLKLNYKRMSYAAQLGILNNNATLRFIENVNRSDGEFGFTPSIYINFQAEYRFDQVNDKWSIIGALSYYGKTNGDAKYKTRIGSFLEQEQIAYLNIMFLSPRFGIRHYLYLGEKIRLFPQIDIALELPIANSQFSYVPNDDTRVEVNYKIPTFSANLSLGLEFSKKVSAEVILPLGNFYSYSNGTAQLDNSRITFALGYRFL